MSGSQQPRQSRWLKWMGLQQQPLEPDAWMAVARDLEVDDAETGSCAEASRMVDALGASGIEAQQRSYVLPDRGRTSNFNIGMLAGGSPAAGRIRIAVVVHNRDLDRANALVAGLGHAERPAASHTTPQSAGLSQLDVTNPGPLDN